MELSSTRKARATQPLALLRRAAHRPVLSATVGATITLE